MKRDYQRNYSASMPSVFDGEGRQRKAVTTYAVIKRELPLPAASARVLVVGGSSGIIDRYLADFFSQVVGLDIDEQAIRFAISQHRHPNLSFLIGDAMHLPFNDEFFDVIVCSHVYEHVPDATQLMREINRTLKPDGICYFAAGNRLNIMEPHYRLPFLSIIPRPLAHLYMRLSGKGKYYYEKHLTYWGLRRLVAAFLVSDYSKSIIEDPESYAADYMLPARSLKRRLARFIARYAFWFMPSYVWILRKQVRTHQEMNLLFITRNFPPQTGGMEQYSYSLYRSLGKHLHVGLLANRRGKKVLPVFLMYALLVVALQGRRYTNIHLGDGVLSVLGLFAKYICKARITITIHALDITYNNRLYQLITRYCLKRLDGVICVSEFTKRECVARGIPESICTVIPNGIDSSDLPVARQTDVETIRNEYDLKNKTVLLSVGRLIKRKGMAWFVEHVMPSLPEKYVLLIAGSGPEGKAIAAVIEEKQLSARVHRLGKVDARMKAALYTIADLFVMPNIEIPGDSEGFGISIIEAGYYGVPCIAADIQGIPNAIIAGTSGTLVRPGDAAGFIDALTGATFDRTKVSQAVRLQYDWSNLAEDYLASLDRSA